MSKARLKFSESRGAWSAYSSDDEDESSVGPSAALRGYGPVYVPRRTSRRSNCE